MTTKTVILIVTTVATSEIEVEIDATLPDSDAIRKAKQMNPVARSAAYIEVKGVKATDAETEAAV